MAGYEQHHVVQARDLIDQAAKDQDGRIKDDEVRWALGDLMVSIWPRRDNTKEEASAIQAELARFAIEVGYKASMLKDFFYVAEQWPQEERSSGASFAQHSKLRGRADRGWALLGIDKNPEDMAEAVRGLTKAQIRKVEKVLKSISDLEGESADMLAALVAQLKPGARSKARSIIAALRQREKQARQDAEALRKAKSPLALVYEYQSHLLGAGARAQAMVEFIGALRSQEERDYVRRVLEGTIFVNQKALEDALDAIDEPLKEDDALEVSSEELKRRAELRAS